MPISMTQKVPGMPREAYDQTIRAIGDSLRAAPGFISHGAVVDDGGATVTELWESREQWQEWFDGNVKPNLSPDLPEAEVTELANALSR